jgi:hypothetical protein
VEKVILFVIYLLKIWKNYSVESSITECVEAVFNACGNDKFKPSIKNSVKGYQIYFRCEFAEKVQRKKNASSR